MDEPVPPRFRPVIASVVSRLASGDFDGIRRDGFLRYDVPDNDFAMYVREYPATLVPLPDQAWEHADVVPLDDGSGWAVTVDLWSREEGRSDLSLEGTLHDTERGPRLLIDNIHVL
jgi:hypothetical protein